MATITLNLPIEIPDIITTDELSSAIVEYINKKQFDPKEHKRSINKKHILLYQKNSTHYKQYKKEYNKNRYAMKKLELQNNSF